MKIENKLALIGILTLENIPPFECSDFKELCPMVISSRDVNDADPGEGYYRCLLLNKEVWGENPECTFSQWQKKALEEYNLKESIT